MIRIKKITKILTACVFFISCNAKEKLYELNILESGTEKAAFIKTVNRGVDAKGNKKPHSCSIVEREDLLKWMLN